MGRKPKLDGAQKETLRYIVESEIEIHRTYDTNHKEWKMTPGYEEETFAPRLTSYEELGKIFDVSRNTIKRAIKNLFGEEERSYRKSAIHSQRMKEKCQDEGYRKAISQRMKEMWQDNEIRQDIVQRMKEKCQDEEHRKAMSQRMKEMWQDNEIRQDIVQRMKERCQDEEYRKAMRMKALDRIKNNHGQIFPNYNPGACQIIELYGQEHGYNLIHAESPATEVNLTDKVRRNNDDGTGECYIVDLGFWIDGYDFINNVVIEYDERRHFDANGELKERDQKRQREIEEFLGCTFIRIKEGIQEEDLESLI